MKSQPTAQRGSVVLVALCLTLVLGVAVTGYVAVCARTMEVSNRSFCTTSSVQLAEIGLEEALWSLDNSSWSGWAPSGNTITRTLTGFTTNQRIPGLVSITVDNYNTTDPFHTPYLTITATGTLTMPGSIQIQKLLQVIVKPAVLFSNAVGAVDPTCNPSVYFPTASGGIVDSYDSALSPNPSDQIQIDNHRTGRAIISGPYISTDNANIPGYAASANSVSYLPNSPSVDPSRISNNANQYAFDIVPPAGGSWTTATDASDLISQTSGGQLGLLGNDPRATSIYNVTGDLELSGSTTLNVVGPVIIMVSGNLRILGSAKIVISNGGTPNDNTDDGSLQIIVDGSTNIGDGGIGGFDNQTLRPRKLAIFCSGSTQSTINTFTAFYGAVYAPNSPLVVNSNLTIYGALVGQSVTLNGTPTIHYDLDLRKATFSVVNTPYDVSQWIVSN